MIFAEWRLARLCDEVYRFVRLDYLRISILTGNTRLVWTYDEFVFGFLCRRIASALHTSGRSLKMSQRQEVLLNVLTRLLGSRHSTPMASQTDRSGAGHGLRFQDGVEFARRLDSARASNRPIVSSRVRWTMPVSWIVTRFCPPKSL